MTDTLQPDLERELAALTAWTGPAPQLWKRALRSGTPRRLPLWPLWAGGGIAALLGLALLGNYLSAALLPPPPEVARGDSASNNWFYGYSQGIAPVEAGQFGYFAAGDAVVGGTARGRIALGTEFAGREIRRQELVDQPPASAAGELAFGRPLEQIAETERYTAKYAAARTGGAAQISTMKVQEVAPERQVVRKATIELATPDVRAAFLKARQLPSLAHGEFIQDSGITGEEKRLQANLTLRVAADRLSEVLAELRTLGKVQTETVGGEDVTAQALDLDARLRNEQRIETELLDLLEQRADAPLKEVLEVRTALGNVRETIEQLTAQREQLARLVSLATVLVLIRSTDAPPDPAPAWSALTYLQERMARAWEGGLRMLVNSLAGLLVLAIGGLVWWVLLLVVLVIVRTWWRRRSARLSS